VSAASPPTEATTFPNPPGIPNVVSINAQSSTEIKIVWYTVNGATSGYKLYRSETKDGQFTKIKETTDTFYTDIGLVAETGYFYRVSAFNSGGESSQSITVTAITWPQPPGQPVGFAAVPTSKKGIALKWSPLVKADAYKLYRVESQPGNYLAIGPSTITDTFYNDTVGLNANTIYYYKLTGINVGGESPQAAFANATTYPDIPTPPTIGVSGGAGRADVTWSPVPYAISYNLYYAVGSTVSKSSKMTAGVTSPQHITGLAPGTQYAFAVTSVNISGESPFSTTQTIVTVPDPPFVSVTPGNGMVTVNWDSAAGATSYTLYFATGTTIDTTTFRYTNAKPPVIINSYPITNGVAYSFAVVSINSSGQSKLSNVASCMPVLPRKMVRITGGTFTMGSNLNDEGPPHQVTVSSFYMDSTPVTLADYQSVGGLNPGGSDGPQSPVCNLSWYDAALFCNQISKKGGLDTTYAYTAATMGSLGSCAGLTGLTIDYSKNGCRLPTEAEYEYACRAGTTTAYYWGDTINGDYCWYSGNSGGKPHDVTQKKPNTFGLYDISGNVWEYCNDYHASYDTTAKMNPTGPAIGTNRTRRGGSYAGLTELRSAARDDANKFPDSGFRCVRR
jgi:formylglycine-generating enzyme required for sulfatase activity